VGCHPGREDAPESLTLADDLDGIIHVLVNLVGAPEHVLAVEHLDVLDDISGGRWR